MDKLVIKRVANGYILTQWQDDEPIQEVFQYRDSDQSEVEACAELLRTIADAVGPTTSRYSPARIYVEVRPGDKYEDCKEEEDLSHVDLGDDY